ncbi:MAG: hypothetical protein KAH84_02080 [Thiomargarita sp.]|nr:hypothetical protein [Thiomargarita sp.]
MQAVEWKTDIAQNGNIHLPIKYKTLYGHHARIIMLIDEKPQTTKQSVEHV